jgi:hypothetical protein
LQHFEAEKIYNQADAEGFFKLNAIRLRFSRFSGVKQSASCSPSGRAEILGLRWLLPKDIGPATAKRLWLR